MKAIAIQPKTQSVHLMWTAAPDPVYGAEEVLVAVRATAVNRADLLQARGLYPPPPGDADILGLEAAGEIVAVGDKVTAWGGQGIAFVPSRRVAAMPSLSPFLRRG